MGLQLHEVFGIATDINKASYVDRGGLDNRLAYLLRTDRHLAIHGDSKQGKSWLRSNALSEEETLVVQCTVDTTSERILEAALGQIGIWAEIRRTGSSELQGSLGLSVSGGVGAKVLAKLGVDVEVDAAVNRGTDTEYVPVGRTPADLGWVARILAESERRLVVEDFHYLSEDEQRSWAFLLKALGEYGVYPIMVGIWPQDHLLTYYNGDLDGRVEDIHLSWSDEEMRAVLTNGAKALGLVFDESLQTALVAESHGNVGLLQRLAERVCMHHGYEEAGPGLTTVLLDDRFADATADVAQGMHGRYQAFADNFVRGMRRMPEGLEVYRHLLQTVTESSDESLLRGIDSAELLSGINAHGEEASIRPSDLTQALDRIERLQAKIGVHPPVLSYNRASRKVFLADRAFLFYRDHGQKSWPWDRGCELTNDLAAQDPFEFDT